MTATMTSMTFIGSASWLSDTCQSDGGFSAAIAVGAVLGEPARGFGLRQSALAVGAQRGDDRVGVLGEPGSGVGGVHGAHGFTI